MRYMPILLIALCLVLAPLGFQAMADEEDHICFSVVDADKDGEATMDEMKKAYPDMDQEKFGKMDSDGNGTVDHMEYEEAMEE